MNLSSQQKEMAYEKLKRVKLAVLLPDDYPVEFKDFRRSFFNIWEDLLTIQKEIFWWQYFKNGRQRPTETFEVKLFENDAFRLDIRRNALIETAMKWGATHLLLLDSDMIFPREVFFLLFRHDLPIVGGLYFHKYKPYDPHIYTRTDTFAKRREYWSLRKYKPNSLINSAIMVKDGQEQERPIHASGAGCLLIKREVIEALKKPPYFKFVEYYDAEGKKSNTAYGSEDFYFFDRLLEETDYRLHIDTAVKCEHIMMRPFRTATESSFIGYNYLQKILNDLI